MYLDTKYLHICYSEFNVTKLIKIFYISLGMYRFSVFFIKIIYFHNI